MSEDSLEQLPIFVYGTLRPGAMQHAIVRSYLTDFKLVTVQGYVMYHFGRFPGIVKRDGQHRAIKGDLLFIHPDKYDECIERLDRYESAGWLFDRRIDFAQTTYLAEPIKCWLYVVREENLSVSSAKVVRQGDWFEYNRV